MRTAAVHVVCSLLACLVMPLASHAALIVYQTPAGSTAGGQPVSASASFSMSADQITVTLQNLQVDPRSVVQCLSGLEFHVGDSQGSASMISSSGTERTIASDGSFTDGSSVATGWSLSLKGSDLDLTMLGTKMAPDHTIIGPANTSTGEYSNSNPSINNGVHSPFLGLSATFTLNVPGVTADSSICGVTFGFGTSPGSTVKGEFEGNNIPEPAYATVISAGLMFGAVLGRGGRRQLAAQVA